MQRYSRPHFYFKPTDTKAKDFAQILGKDTGIFPQTECDVIVTIPGDGTVYHAFHHAVNKPVFAVKPTTSNSLLFSGHENIEDGCQLLDALSDVSTQDIHPLITNIYLSDGEMETVKSYVDINIRSDNAQATLIHECINVVPTTPKPVMGSGWIVATPLGSTALNETRNGKVVSLNSGQLVRTMNGVSNVYERRDFAKKDMISVAVDDSSAFDIQVAYNAEKRVTKVDYDSWSYIPTSGAHITSVNIRMNKTSGVSRTLLLNPKYRTPNPFY